MVLPKNTLVGLAGQKAWHICAGLAPPRVVSGKYRPSQLRTQNAGPAPADAAGRGAGLRRGFSLLLSLQAAKQEIEQVFGGG
jgi:hypothetical protein